MLLEMAHQLRLLRESVEKLRKDVELLKNLARRGADVFAYDAKGVVGERE
jgi:hypothetical protein